MSDHNEEPQAVAIPILGRPISAIAVAVVVIAAVIAAFMWGLTAALAFNPGENGHPNESPPDGPEGAARRRHLTFQATPPSRARTTTQRLRSHSTWITRSPGPPSGRIENRSLPFAEQWRDQRQRKRQRRRLHQCGRVERDHACCRRAERL